MNTPAHAIFGLAGFSRPGRPSVTLAALAGGILPDLSLFVMVGWQLNVVGTPARTVFGEMYFSDAWQNVFRIDNSIPLWTLALGLALLARSAPAIAFCGAGLLHLFCDLPLHGDDARAQFWPLTDWVFRSPVSYWDNRHYGNVVAPLEIAVSLLLCVILWRRHRTPWVRGGVILLALLEAVPGMVGPLVF